MRLPKHLLVLALATACATTTSHVASRELVAARADYQRAARSPAATVAPNDVAAARDALARAESANRDTPLSDVEKHFAYIASRRAEIAMLRAERIATERDAIALHADLNRRAADAQRVADQSARAVESANAEAQAANERAARETAERENLETQVQANRRDLQRLESELADTRNQLAERRDQADSETVRLKARETNLQAQIETLRAERDRAERDRTLAQRERDQLQTTLRGFATINDNDARGLVITMPSEIMFRSGSARLLPTAKDKLDDLASALSKLDDEQTFVIEGHTDARGSAAFNRRLSQRRAQAVRAYLIEQGISPQRIVARGKGSTEPVASNSDPEGRANNRRVEIVVTPSVVGGR